MFLAIAVLLFHPQVVAPDSSPAENDAIDASAAISLSTDGIDAENSTLTASASALVEAAPEPAAKPTAGLPDAPVPVSAVSAPAPMAFLKPAKPLTVSVAELQAENRRKERAWRGLAIATSGAATFDAWTTRHAITTTGAVELNPLLKPFAGNSSIYAAIQVAPVLFDFAARKMMYSRRSWVRRVWWVPQSASFIGSLSCGAHNLADH
jgi:hypothetical protein